MTPDEREQDIADQVDNLTDEALDAAERDLQRDLLDAGNRLAECLIKLQTTPSLRRPPREIQRRLLDALERHEWQLDRLMNPH